jgi:hypothetical protein
MTVRELPEINLASFFILDDKGIPPRDIIIDLLKLRQVTLQ